MPDTVSCRPKAPIELTWVAGVIASVGCNCQRVNLIVAQSLMYPEFTRSRGLLHVGDSRLQALQGRFRPLGRLSSIDRYHLVVGVEVQRALDGGVARYVVQFSSCWLFFRWHTIAHGGPLRLSTLLGCVEKGCRLLRNCRCCQCRAHLKCHVVRPCMCSGEIVCRLLIHRESTCAIVGSSSERTFRRTHALPDLYKENHV